jgi:hypothetical protein
MPHVVYLAANILCPWPGCDYPIELVDFQVEKMGDLALYTRVMGDWGRQPGFGLVARCPNCGQHVLFGSATKQPVSDPEATGLPILPDDWHLNASIL